MHILQLFIVMEAWKLVELRLLTEGQKITSPKSVMITKNSTVKKTLSNLRAKKKYYLRIRTYKTVNGKKYYSAWSKYKTVTTR